LDSLSPSLSSLPSLLLLPSLLSPSSAPTPPSPSSLPSPPPPSPTTIKDMWRAQYYFISQWHFILLGCLYKVRKKILIPHPNKPGFFIYYTIISIFQVYSELDSGVNLRNILNIHHFSSNVLHEATHPWQKYINMIYFSVIVVASQFGRFRISLPHQYLADKISIILINNLFQV
jgi:hypothetical protein